MARHGFFVSPCIYRPIRCKYKALNQDDAILIPEFLIIRCSWSYTVYSKYIIIYMAKWLTVNFRSLMNGGLWIRDKNIFSVDHAKLSILLGIGFFSGSADFSRFWNEMFIQTYDWSIFFFTSVIQLLQWTKSCPIIIHMHTVWHFINRIYSLSAFAFTNWF